jgi:aspartate ammonia-lyase
MSQTSRAFVAASVGVVEAMKDQLGICRWNHVIRSAQQNAKNHLRSFSQAKNLSSSTSAMVLSKARESEESLRTVMYLSCWGPN